LDRGGKTFPKKEKGKGEKAPTLDGRRIKNASPQVPRKGNRRAPVKKDDSAKKKEESLGKDFGSPSKKGKKQKVTKWGGEACPGKRIEGRGGKGTSKQSSAEKHGQGGKKKKCVSPEKKGTAGKRGARDSFPKRGM